MYDIFVLPVGFFLRCFVQQHRAVQPDVAKKLPLQTRSPPHSSKSLSQWEGRSVPVLVEKWLCRSATCSTWTIFTSSLCPSGLWSPSCTRISAKPQQTVLHPKLFYNSSLRVLLLNLFSHCAGMYLIFGFRSQKTIPKAGQDRMWYRGSQLPGGRVKVPCPPALPSLFRAAVYHPTRQSHWPQPLLGTRGDGRGKVNQWKVITRKNRMDADYSWNPAQRMKVPTLHSNCL